MLYETGMNISCGMLQIASLYDDPVEKQINSMCSTILSRYPKFQTWEKYPNTKFLLMFSDVHDPKTFDSYVKGDRNPRQGPRPGQVLANALEALFPGTVVIGPPYTNVNSGNIISLYQWYAPVYLVGKYMEEKKVKAGGQTSASRMAIRPPEGRPLAT